MQSNYKRWIVAALPLAMACTVSAQGKVTDVSTRQIDGGLAVHIGGSDLAKPATKWDHGALVLEFQAGNGPKSATLKPNEGGIKAISFGRESHSFNVAIRPSGSKDLQMVKVSDGWLVYFEQGIPDKIDTSTPKVVTTANQKVVAKPIPVNPRDFRPKAMVTLNFVDTDLQQILKALSMQANVNVAMGPDVAGKVTVNLDNVPVDEAMQMVTTLGGVDFAYMNNTYVVASPAKFADMIERMSNRADTNAETRVVPLFSREGNQVKAAILKMVPPSTVDGKYEIVLPSEKLDVLSTQAITPQSGSQGGGSGSGAQGTQGGSTQGTTQTNTQVQQLSSDSDKKDDYIVLIATPGRMSNLEQAVRSVDQQICFALGIKVGTSQAIVKKTYQPKGILAADLVKALLGSNKDFDGVQLVATPGKSISKQMIVLSGREADVDRVMDMVSEVDTTTTQGDAAYEVVGLKYVQPNVIFGQLISEVPGLKVSILPPPIDPTVGVDVTTSFVAPTGGEQAPSSAASGAGAPASSSGGPSAGAQSAGGPSSSGGGSGSSSGSTSGSPLATGN